MLRRRRWFAPISADELDRGAYEDPLPDDEMEGSISYEIRGTDDTLSHWDMNVSQGKIQLDERWTHLDDAGEYQLMSADSVSHAYLIADDQVDQVLWMNLLGWD